MTRTVTGYTEVYSKTIAAIIAREEFHKAVKETCGYGDKFEVARKSYYDVLSKLGGAYLDAVTEKLQ